MLEGVKITDWLMVAITFIYVIATIVICVFNGRTVKAAYKQLEEMEREFNNSRRLTSLPFLSVVECTPPEIIHATIPLLLCKDGERTNRSKDFYFTITNVGHDMAKEITYTFEPDGPSGPESIVSLSVGDSRNACIQCQYYGSFSRHERTKYASFKVSYKDLFENKYFQMLSIAFLIDQETISIKSYHITAPYPANYSEESLFYEKE